MSLLDNLPDRCSILRRVRSKGTLGGSRDSMTTEQTNVPCWQQQMGSSESAEYEKKGFGQTVKVYFVSDLGITARHRIVVTSRNGTAIAAADQRIFEAISTPYPDASVGRGMLWRVDCSYTLGEDD